MKAFRHLSVLATAVLCLASCSKQASQSSEADAQATAFINRIFTGSKEYWFAADKLLGSSEKYQLVQLHNPRKSLFPENVTDTDRMNGVTLRYRLIIECDQSRSWNGEWTPWKEGTGGKGAFLNTLMPGIGLGYWVVRFEKVNDEWHSKNAFPVHNLVENQALLETLMRSAGISL